MSPRSSFFLQPLNTSCGVSGLVLAVLTLSFVPPCRRPARVVLGLLVLCLCLLALINTDRRSHEGQSFAEAMFGLGLHAFNKIVLEPTTPEPLPAQRNLWETIAASLKDLFTFRRRREGAAMLERAPRTASTTTATASTISTAERKDATRSRYPGGVGGSSRSGKRSKANTSSPPQTSQQRPQRFAAAAAVGSPSWRAWRVSKAVLQLGAFWYLRSHALIPGLQPTYYDFVSARPLLVSLVLGRLKWRAFLLRLNIVATSLIMPSLVLCAAHNFSAAILAVSHQPPRVSPSSSQARDATTSSGSSSSSSNNNNSKGLSEGDDTWPGLYGSLGAAYSVGQWYSGFWHTLMRRAFTLPARLFTAHVLGLVPGSEAGRAAILVLAFAISGIMHTLTSWSPGMCAPLSWSELWWHLATALAILVERALERAYASVRARVLGSEDLAVWEARGWRLVGYVWTATWWLDGFGSGVLWPWILCGAKAARSQK